MTRQRPDYMAEITKVLTEEYGCEDVKPESSLRMLGLDSLEAAELLIDLETMYGLEFSPEESLTVERLVEMIEAKQ